MEGNPTTITPLQKEEKSCTLMSWVMTIIALPRESTFCEVGMVSNGVSSSDEPASASVSVAGVEKPSPDIEFLCVDGPEVGGDLSSSPDPRSRTFNSTAACLPIFPRSLIFFLLLRVLIFRDSKIQKL
jgi:hypothetical protein